MSPDRWAMVERVFHAVVELPGDARERMLDDCCGANEALRHEVGRLLAAERKSDRLLIGNAWQDAAQALARDLCPSLTGRSLGHYQVKEWVGGGGMGEVYRARDTRLQRDVAVKVLPGGEAGDSDRLRRFDREARATLMLNHPNILTVYDVGMHEGMPYIVSELLQGQTLRSVLREGALAFDASIDIALQLARGVAAAHQSGVIHRDLKPENLFITSAGGLKILDFGLAKLLNPEPTGLNRSSGLTRSGAIMGTASYMSPEQTLGEPADRRSDIFAIGSLLYELFFGRRAFAAASVSETLHRVQTYEPPGIAPPAAMIAPELAVIIRRCLHKSPELRLESADALARALEAIRAREGRIGASRSDPRGWPTSRWAAIIAFALAAVVLLLILAPRAEAPRSVLRFTVPPPETARLIAHEYTAHTFALSPDGQQLAFTAESNGRRQLWVRALSELTARPLAGTDGAIAPFWSPDSRQVGFFATGKLAKVVLQDGAVSVLADVGRNYDGGAWNGDGTVLFTGKVASDRVLVMRVSESGGTPEPVTVAQSTQGETLHLWPTFLPDGRHFLYLVRDSSGHSIRIQALDTGETQVLFRAQSRVAYAQGYLLYVHEGSLVARPFDTERLRVSGDPVRLAEHVNYFAPTGHAQFSASNDGVLAYAAAKDSAKLVWVSPDGQATRELGRSANYRSLSLSPDGAQALVSVMDPQLGSSDIWSLDLALDTEIRATDHPATEIFPVWSPDGQQMVYAADRLSAPFLHIRWLREAGDGRELTRRTGGVQKATDWSRDGALISYSDTSAAGDLDIWLAFPRLESPSMPWLQTRFAEFDARFSPDGRYIAYVSDASGRHEIYVRPVRGDSAARRVSTGGGTQPRWHPAGSELYYVASDEALLGASVKLGKEVEIGRPRELFRYPTPAVRDYAVSRDGHFLMAVTVTSAAACPLNVVVNWAAELQTTSVD